MAGCKGWKVDTGEYGDEDWTLDDTDRKDDVGADGRVRVTGSNDEEIEAVRTLERNWARFMGLLDDTR